MARQQKLSQSGQSYKLLRNEDTVFALRMHSESFAIVNTGQANLQGPVPRKKVKFDPRLNQILSTVFLSRTI